MVKIENFFLIRNMKAKKDLIEGQDYYISDQGYWVFTEKYHLERGFCCSNKCRHCPYQHKNVSDLKQQRKLNIKK